MDREILRYYQDEEYFNSVEADLKKMEAKQVSPDVKPTLEELRALRIKNFATAIANDPGNKPMNSHKNLFIEKGLNSRG